MAQKSSRKSFRKHAIIGSAAVAGVVAILLALTYAQPQRQDIIQDKPQGAAGLNRGRSRTSQKYLRQRAEGRLITSGLSQAELRPRR